MKKATVTALILLAIFLVPALHVVEIPATNAQTQAQGYQVISAQWGTSTTNAEAGPGDQDVPLTLTIQYIYPYEAQFAQLDVALPSGFSSTSSETSHSPTTNATLYYTSKLAEGQVFQVQTFLNLAKNLTLGKYTFAATFLWSAVLTNTTSAPEVPLEQNTQFSVGVQGDSKLVFNSPDRGLVPGRINNVTLVLANQGSGNVSNVLTTITSNSPQSLSVLNEVPSTPQLDADSSTSYSLELYVAAGASGSSASLSLSTTYLDAYNNQQTITQSLGLFIASTNATPTLVYRSLQSSLVPGEVNNISLTAQNEGNVELYGISTQVTSSSQAVSVLSQPALIASLSTGANAPLQISLFVSGSASNTPLTLSIAAGYTIAGNNNSGSVSQTLGMYVSSQNGAASGASLSVSTISGNVTTGRDSLVSFMVKNTGASPLYNPTFLLSVTTPLVVTANSSYTWGGTLAPQQGLVYQAEITTSPSSTSGVYDGTLSVNYSNQYGIANSQTVQVGFVLTGVIELVIQGETVTQSGGNLTVSGTLLNEGTASAYYASAAGYVSPGTKQGPVSYIGEIDPNTPVPFTATIPYTPSSTTTHASVTVVITYRDNFGNSLSTKSNDSTTIAPLQATVPANTGTASDTAGASLVVIVFYAIIIAVIASAVAGAILVRRRRHVATVGPEDSKVV